MRAARARGPRPAQEAALEQVRRPRAGPLPRAGVGRRGPVGTGGSGTAEAWGEPAPLTVSRGAAGGRRGAARPVQLRSPMP